MVDELILVDLTRNSESWPSLLNVVSGLSGRLATPLTVGGGVETENQVKELLDVGADKVIINTGAFSQPFLLDQVADRFGATNIVLSVDYWEDSDSRRRVFINGGKTNTDRDVEQWVLAASQHGFGEVLLCSIGRDGSGTGLDLQMVANLREKISTPILISGGCGKASDFVEAFTCGAAGVAVGTYFAQRDHNPVQCRSYVRNAGIPVRSEI
jgi:imidazole glycerol-phosphate synthase subunit HisF